MSILHRADSLLGSAAQAALVLLALGTASTTRAADITVVAPFTGAATGAVPYAGVTRDSSGNLFGTTENGGSANLGTVWEIPTGTTTLKALASFTGANGANPFGGVAVDSSGNLFGTANKGGSASDGTVWEIAAGTTTLKTLASFTGANGANPFCEVTIDSSGNLFGTAFKGGSSNVGTVWEIVHGSTTITPLASFDGTNGANPNGALALDYSGNLFGTTVGGGSSSNGTVWELPHGAAAVSVLASFDGTNGATPEAGLTRDSSGNLFGTAYQGGSSSDGTVWELPSGSTTIKALAPFTGTNGTNPFGKVIIDGAGNLFGTTFYGGSSDDGTIFEIPVGGSLVTLASFKGTNGANPSGLLTIDSSGNLLGASQQGGSGSDGVVFEMAGVATPIDRSHLLWTNTNGTASLWTVTATGKFSSKNYGPLSGLTAKAVADGPDAKTRLLWNNTSGQMSLWSLNNDTGAYTQHSFGPFAGWSALAVSVTPTNVTHILWTNTNGQASVWNYSTANGTYTQKSYGPFAGWKAVSLADGPDGQVRLLWVNTNGTASLWSLNNSTGSYTQHSFGPFSGWGAKSVSAGPDNTTHVLWTNVNGAASVWNYSTATGAYMSHTFGPFSGWTAASLADGADGVVRLLWDNSDGHASVWRLNSVSGAYTQFTFGPYAGWTADALSAGP